jgi:hypothetical protein
MDHMRTIEHLKLSFNNIAMFLILILEVLFSVFMFFSSTTILEDLSSTFKNIRTIED